MSPLVPLDDVRGEILAAVAPLDPVDVAVRQAHGLVLAAAVTTDEAVPPFANTAMDGYAVRAADTAGAAPGSPVTLRVVDEVAAGRAPEIPVGPGEAIRIMTGAPMPPGADAVVMVEQTRAASGAGVERPGRSTPEETPLAASTSGGVDVDIEAAAAAGQHVREAGGDLQAGQTVFEPGTVLGAAAIGVLASIGTVSVRVFPRPKVGVLSTGDELVEAGPLAPGKIRDSNRPMLVELAREAGFEAVDLGIAVDDEERIVATLDDAFRRCDAVLTSGGVSVGDYDYVKAALERFGALEWRQVAIKPAKPLAFGVVKGVPVFGLPGNPVSSLVSYECFARPALLQMAGHARRFRPEVLATAAHPLSRRRDGKLHLHRVRIWWEGSGYVATSTGEQASNALAATAAANGLALLEDGDGVDAGATVRVMLLDAPADH